MDLILAFAKNIGPFHFFLKTFAAMSVLNGLIYFSDAMAHANALCQVGYLRVAQKWDQVYE
jgi:hypothetical protein